MPKHKGIYVSFAMARCSRRLKLVNELLKYKQNWVYVPQSKFKLLVLKGEYDSQP